MAFPEDPLGLRAEAQIGGVWTDVTSRLRTSDPLVASYGMSAEGSRVDPSTCTLMLDNTDGALSPRNPLSPWYGQLGRNIPVRVTVPLDESYLSLDGTPTGVASTPDTAALDIVGDIDVRVEATADWERVPVQNLLGKWTATGNQRSWILQLNNGNLYFRWSENGTATLFGSYPLPVLPPRAALRVTLDVNDGAGGLALAFYWAPTLAGPWTLFGTRATTATGITSIFNSTGPLLLTPASPVPVDPWLPVDGRVHRAEVRSGIGGTVVAAPDFRALPPGTTSFADTAGRTWSLAGTAEVSNREYLFAGEMSKSPPRWVPSGKLVWVPVEAAGILRRLGQGRKALDSTLRRKVPDTAGVLAYWPMEEAREATQAYSPIARVKPMQVTGLEFASVDTLPSSSPLPAVKTPASINGVVPPPPSGSTEWHLSWLYRIDTAPTVDRTYMGITSTGTVRRWAIAASTTGSQITGYDADGDTVFTQAIATGLDLFGQWVNASFRARQVGSDVEWQIIWRDIGGDAGGFLGSFPGAVGRCTGVISPSAGFHSDLDGMAIGHMAVFNTWDTTAYIGAVDGYAGETAIDRLGRLASEEPALGLSWIDGDMTRSSARMGPQRPAILTDLLQECADSDGGILMERRDRLGLVYRDRTSLENQAPAITLDYTARQVMPPLEPVDDDKWTRNDITVTRIGGSAARVIVADGPLSVQPPELGGVGLYDEAVTLSLYNDNQPIQIAGWRAHLGTHDEARYPSVKIRLDRLPELIPAVLGMRIGDTLRIINTPTFVAPGPIDLQVRKITHTPRPRVWEVVFDCLPAGPWNVAVVGVSKADTAGSELAAGVDAANTMLSVVTTVGPRWVDASMLFEFPFDIRVGGEVMTVQQITGLVQDAFARTVATGWGTATSGQAWTTTGGSTADYSVQGA